MVYLDSAASTSLAPEAFASMGAVLQGGSGNPGSSHWAGTRARQIVEAGRAQVADLMGVGTSAVIFTGSATESNNLALRGLMGSGNRNEVITTAVEHASVLKEVERLRADGALVHVLPVDAHGQLERGALDDVLTERTALVSVAVANNETGVMQDIAAVADRAHELGALVHTDASQLMAWGRSDVLAECDLVTVSSHKMHGPQGIAALVASRVARGRLTPQHIGGGQELGLRSGTVNVAGVAGFGAAAELALSSGTDAATAVTRLRLSLVEGLCRELPGLVENGVGARSRLPGLLNVSIAMLDGLDAEALLAQAPLLAASTGSACRAGAPEPSPVLLAMGSSEQQARSSIRLSLSRFSTEADVRAAVSMLATAAERVRAAAAGQSILNGVPA